MVDVEEDAATATARWKMAGYGVMGFSSGTAAESELFDPDPQSMVWYRRWKHAEAVLRNTISRPRGAAARGGEEGEAEYKKKRRRDADVTAERSPLLAPSRATEGGDSSGDGHDTESSKTRRTVPGAAADDDDDAWRFSHRRFDRIMTKFWWYIGSVGPGRWLLLISVCALLLIVAGLVAGEHRHDNPGWSATMTSEYGPLEASRRWINGLVNLYPSLRPRGHTTETSETTNATKPPPPQLHSSTVHVQYGS